MVNTLHSMRIPLDQTGKRSLHLEFDPGEIYAPTAFSSVFLIRNVDVKPDDVALDLGTGSGVYAVGTAVLGARHVTAVDLYDKPLETARHNAELNGVVDKITFCKGSMFEPLPKNQRFSLIVSNPPCMPDPGPIKNHKLTKHDSQIMAGLDGSHLPALLLEQAPQHLSPDGRVVFVQPSTSNPKRIFALLDKLYNYRILAQIEIEFALHFLEIWEYLIQLREAGLSEFYEKNGVPYRTYWLIEARPK